MDERLECEVLEHLLVVINKLENAEDKYLILDLVCRHSFVVGEIDGMKIGLGLKEKS